MGKFENYYEIYFSIKFQDEKNLRNNRKYTIIDTNKAGVRFRNGMLRELNDQYIVSKENYMEQQKSVVDEIIDIACKSFQ